MARQTTKQGAKRKSPARTPGAGQVTRNDVARLARTSTAVVSYVINEGPRPVSEETRARVLAAIKKLGYRPNRLAQALRKRRSGLVGLILPDTETPYFSALATAVENELFSRGLLALIGSSGFDHWRETRYAEAFADLQVDGMLIASVGPSDGQAIGHTPQETPTVYIHRAGPDPTWPLVAHDDVAAGEVATQHLLDHGHESVLCVAALADGPIGDRVTGWERALHRAGIRRKASMLLRIPNNRAEATRAVTAWLADNPQTTAVFAATDELAFGVIRAAATLGRRIPDDLALIGCDGLEEGEHSVPRLSSVSLSLRPMAEAAIARLLGEKHSDAPARVTIPVKLTPRESCGCHR